MRLDLYAQTLSLCRSLLLGALLGLGYDFLRPPRRRGGRLLSTLLDLLFCVFAGDVCFVEAMSGDSGRIGLWELSASLLGFLFYLYLLSPVFLPVFSSLFGFLSKIIGWFKKFFAKSHFFAKKYFQKVRK
jgi:hypothetical protein